MTSLEDERDIDFVNTLSTVISIISISIILLLIGYILVLYFLSNTTYDHSILYLFASVIMIPVVLISGSISIKRFNNYGYVVLSGFFVLFSMIHLSSMIYLITYNLLNDNPFSIIHLIIYILLFLLSLVFYYIFNRLKQIFDK